MDGKQGKPMAVFGEKWNNHCERIFENWSNTVNREDLVLIPGDICWAMQLNDAIDDINKLSALPGTKLLLRGLLVELACQDAVNVSRGCSHHSK